MNFVLNLDSAGSYTEPGGLNRARIWVDECPSLEYEPEELFERSFTTLHRTYERIQKAAAELRIVTGPRALNGVLGAEFHPGSTGELHVTVASSAANGAPFEDSMCRWLDDVRIGLPREYVASVFEGILQSKDVDRLGGGSLSFWRAAHGPVGSCPLIFFHLSRIVINLLLHTRGPFDQESIREIVDRDRRL